MEVLHKGSLSRQWVGSPKQVPIPRNILVVLCAALFVVWSSPEKSVSRLAAAWYVSMIKMKAVD